MLIKGNFYQPSLLFVDSLIFHRFHRLSNARLGKRASKDVIHLSHLCAIVWAKIGLLYLKYNVCNSLMFLSFLSSWPNLFNR